MVPAAVSVHAGGSVFSANGVGEEQVGGGVRAAGLGGGAFGVADTMGFNSLNPALLGYVPRTVVRIGGHVAYWNTASQGRSASDEEMMWKDLAVHVRLTSRWKAGLGIQPMRRQQLLLIAQRTAEFPGDDDSYPPILPVAIPYEERTTWAGSTVDLRIDNAYRFSDQFALGVSAIYTVQHNQRSAVVDFTDDASWGTYRDVRIDEVTTFRGWSLAIGGYYAVVPRIAVGGFFRPRLQGSWTRELRKSGADSTVNHDGMADMPGEFGVGLNYRVSSDFRAVADLRMGQWNAGDYGPALSKSARTVPADPTFVSVGIERSGRNRPLHSGFDLWGYRAGLFYRSHYWEIAPGNSVEDIGAVLGVSIPVAKYTGWLHSALEVGLRGTDEDRAGAQETFVRFSFQVEVGETWFNRARPRLPE